MSRGVPARNLVMRALESITEKFRDKDALRLGVTERLRVLNGKVTGSMRSSLEAFIARRRVHLRGSAFRPHQGKRECARRRGDWGSVSIIDAQKRYPYGINHRFPSINRPDRVEVSFPKPELVAEKGRIILPQYRS